MHWITASGKKEIHTQKQSIMQKLTMTSMHSMHSKHQYLDFLDKDIWSSCVLQKSLILQHMSLQYNYHSICTMQWGYLSPVYTIQPVSQPVVSCKRGTNQTGQNSMTAGTMATDFFLFSSTTAMCCIAYHCAYHCAQLSYTIQHINRFDNLPSYPLDDQHCSDVVYWIVYWRGVPTVRHKEGSVLGMGQCETIKKGH